MGLVQKVLVEKVWPDWEKAIEAEEGREGLLVFERWFVPPTTCSSTSAIRGTVATTSYSVLSSILSTKSASDLQSRSLEIVSSLLVKLNSAFNICEVYLTTLGIDEQSRTPAKVEGDSDEEEEDERIDPARLAAWDTSLRDMVGIPVRLANIWGTLSEKRGVRLADSLPNELGSEYVDSNSSGFRSTHFFCRL